MCELTQNDSNLFNYDYKKVTPEFVEDITEKYIKQLEEIYNIEYPASTLIKILSYENDKDKLIYSLYNVSTNKDVRDTILKCKQKLNEASLKYFITKRVYLKLKTLYDNTEMFKQSFYDYSYISSDELFQIHTILSNTIIDLELEGMNKSEEIIEQIKIISDQISKLCLEFKDRLNNYNTSIYFSESDLIGMPQSFLDMHKDIDTNKFKLDVSYPDVFPVLEYCKNRTTREIMYRELKKKGGDLNLDIAAQIFKLRNEKAILLGFKNHAEYKLKKSLVKTPENLQDFLNKIESRVNSYLSNDLSKLKSVIPEEEFSSFNYVHNSNMDSNSNYEQILLSQWDLSYLARLYKLKYCNVDSLKLKSYLRDKDVVRAVLDFYQTYLDYKFVKRHNAKLWHESVECYDVFEYDKYIGTFYLDLFPREGKYGHACCSQFLAKTKSNPNVSLIICNFGKDGLTFGEYKTFLHEFGHCMHSISNRNVHADLSSFSVEWDFVEVPSQMFEEFAYDKDLLLNINKDIPLDLIENATIHKNVFASLQEARTLGFAQFDYKVHSSTQSELETMNFNLELLKSLETTTQLKLTSTPEINDLGSFAHLFGGYDCGYYSYIYSHVMSRDLYEMIINSSDPKTMILKFKEMILNHGGLYYTIDNVEKFLGRDVQSDAYFNILN